MIKTQTSIFSKKSTFLREEAPLIVLIVGKLVFQKRLKTYTEELVRQLSERVFYVVKNAHFNLMVLITLNISEYMERKCYVN